MRQRTTASRRFTAWSFVDRMDGAVNRALGYTTTALVMFSIGCSPDRSLHGYNLGAAYEDLAPGLICQHGISPENGRWDALLEYPTDSTAADLRYCVPVPEADSILWPHDNNHLAMVFDDDRLVEVEGFASFEEGTRRRDNLEIPPPETWRVMLQHLTDAFGAPPDSINRFLCDTSTDESLCLAYFRLYWPPSHVSTHRQAVVFLHASPPGADVVNVVLRSYEKAVRCLPHACDQRRLSASAARLLDYLFERMDSARAASDSVPP